MEKIREELSLLEEMKFCLGYVLLKKPVSYP
jgi:hypothetical protein